MSVPKVSGSEVTVELDEDFVALVEIHRSPNNYIDAALVASLADAYEALDEDPACRAIVLCSEGKHFCAGGSLAADAADPAGQLQAAAADRRRLSPDDRREQVC
jgi:enoyl-CoA hydratase/carnithine racemase